MSSRRALITSEIEPRVRKLLEHNDFECEAVNDITCTAEQLLNKDYDVVITYKPQQTSVNVSLRALRMAKARLPVLVIEEGAVDYTQGEDSLVLFLPDDFTERELLLQIEVMQNRKNVELQAVETAWKLDRQIEALEQEPCVEGILKILADPVRDYFSADKIYWFEGGAVEKFLLAKTQNVLPISGDVSFQAYCPDGKPIDSTIIGNDIRNWSLTWFQSRKKWIWSKAGGLIQAFYADKKFIGCLYYANANQKIKLETVLQNPLMQVLESRMRQFTVISHYKEKTNIDFLTGLYNQKFLVDALDKQISIYGREKKPFAALFIDVDHFKRVNDGHGHIVGSNVLKQLANVIQQKVRVYDYAFRYGGDEFIVLLRDSDQDVSQMVAERIRSSVEDYKFSYNDIDLKITISIGVAMFPQHAKVAADLIRIADEAMYYGKNKSRNIVYVAS